MIYELFKLLNNPLKIEMLLRIHSSREGFSVGQMADEMQRYGLEMSSVSLYLKQLGRTGAIRRSRAGKYVNYIPDMSRAPDKVRKAVEAIVPRLKNGNSQSLDEVFAALMNPFRAKVVSALAKAASISAAEICEKTCHQSKYLRRDLQAAIDAKLIDCDSPNTSTATYRFIPQSDPLVQLLIELC